MGIDSDLNGARERPLQTVRTGACVATNGRLALTELSLQRQICQFRRPVLHIAWRTAETKFVALGLHSSVGLAGSMKTAFATQPGAPAASDDLGALRAALDARLTALEAGLANPDECESLEALILDLARVATDEAEAAARRAARQGQVDANKQLTTALAEAQTAEAALDAQRAASLDLQRELEEARSELNAERRQTKTAVTKEVERARATLETERTTNAALQAELHEAGQRLAASEAARQKDADALAARQRDIAALREDAATAQAAHQRAIKAAQDGAVAAAATIQRELEAAKREAAAAVAAHQKELQAAQRDAAATVAAHQKELQAAQRDAVAAAATAHKKELQAVQRDAAAALAKLQRELEAAQSDAAAALAKVQRELQAAQRDAATVEATHALELQAAQGDVGDLVTTLQRQLEIAQGDFASQAADLDAARARIEALEQSHAELKDAVNEAQASAEAAHRDRDDLAHALEDARQEARAGEGVLQVESTPADRASAQRALREAEARADAAVRDRDAALAELAAAREAGGTAQENDRRFEELREKSERRILDLEVALLRGNVTQQGHEEVEIAVPLDDTFVVVKDELPTPAAPAAAPARSARAATSAPAGGAAPGQPTRGASRQAFREALAVQIDGEQAMLVDLSISGAQVLSQTALKPARAVRMLLPSADQPVLCRGKIAWARLEPASKGKSFRYRAGLFFTATDEAAVQAFMIRHAGGPSTDDA